MNSSDKKTKLYRMGCIAFFFSGICAMSSGVIVSQLQEYYGFAYGVTGTLLSLMNIGNLVAGFASAILPLKLGTRAAVLIMTSGYALACFYSCQISRKKCSTKGRKKGKDGLELFKGKEILADYRTYFLSECSRDQCDRLDGYLL